VPLQNASASASVSGRSQPSTIANWLRIAPIGEARRRRNGTNLRHRAAMALDHDFLAIFDEVEQLRRLRLRSMNADVHV
jgi:hypothetical protein